MTTATTNQYIKNKKMIAKIGAIYKIINWKNITLLLLDYWQGKWDKQLQAHPGAAFSATSYFPRCLPCSAQYTESADQGGHQDLWASKKGLYIKMSLQRRSIWSNYRRKINMQEDVINQITIQIARSGVLPKQQNKCNCQHPSINAHQQIQTHPTF